jgi:hypothetical protein
MRVHKSKYEDLQGKITPGVFLLYKEAVGAFIPQNTFETLLVCVTHVVYCVWPINFFLV